MRVALRVAMSLAVFLVMIRAAQAEQRRLALIDGGPILEHAIVSAVTPWEIDVVTVPGPTPSPEMDRATREAHEIAARERVDAVAWLDEHAIHRTLWLYDVHEDEMVTRQVTNTMIDEAAAAAIALSLKTLLRASSVAPPQEQRGGRAEARAHGPGLVRIEIDGGARLRTSEQTFLAPRVGLAAAFWPRLFDERVGAVLRLEEGVGVPVNVHEFAGRLYDHTPSLSLRTRLPLGRMFSLEPSVGGALHVTVLTGGSIDGRPPVDMVRVNTALEASLAVFATFARWALVGVRVGSSYWGSWQRYLVEGHPVLVLPPLQGAMTFVIGGSVN